MLATDDSKEALKKRAAAKNAIYVGVCVFVICFGDMTPRWDACWAFWGNR